jgi:hypothetical protein
MESHTVHNRYRLPIRWVDNVANLSRPFCKGYKMAWEKYGIQFLNKLSCIELTPSSRGHINILWPEYTWSMHIQNFVSNVPAKGIKSQITSTQAKKYIYNLNAHTSYYTNWRNFQEWTENWRVKLMSLPRRLVMLTRKKNNTRCNAC